MRQDRLLKQQQFPYRYAAYKSSPEYIQELKLIEEINSVKAKLHEHGQEVGKQIIEANEAKQKQARDAKRNSPEAQAKREQRRAIRREGWNEVKEGIKEQYSSAVETAVNAGKSIAKALPLGDSKEAIIEGIKGGKVFEGMGKQVKGVVKVVKGAGKAIFNDLKWYNNYPEASALMIGPNFNRRVGAEEPLIDLNTTASYKPSIPVAASVIVTLTEGSNLTGAVNASYNKIFTSIRQANSGSVNWTTQELSVYFKNFRHLIAGYAIACRALRELNRYSITNKGVPYANFAAMGLDYDTFSQNAANLRNHLLNLRTRMKCYAVPILDIFKRTEWLFSSAYWDSNDAKHQTIYFINSEVAKSYNYVTGSAVNMPSFKANPDSSRTGITYSNFMTQLLLAETYATNYDKFGIMSGDIVKAFGPNGVYTLPEVPSVDAKPLEGFSEEVLTQIQNAWTMTMSESGLNIAITLPTNVSEPMTETITVNSTAVPTSAAAKLNESTFINMYKNDITNLDVLQATRLAALGTLESSTYYIKAYGTEIFNGMYVYYYDYGTGSSNLYKVCQQVLTSVDKLNVTTVAGVELSGMSLMGWATIDWMPRHVNMFEFFLSGQSSATQAYGFTLWDFNNYAVIGSTAELQAIHDVAVQSLYYVPLKARDFKLVTY